MNNDNTSASEIRYSNDYGGSGNRNSTELAMILIYALRVA